MANSVKKNQDMGGKMLFKVGAYRAGLKKYTSVERGKVVYCLVPGTDDAAKEFAQVLADYLNKTLATGMLINAARGPLVNLHEK